MTTAWQAYQTDGTTQYEDREESPNVSSLRDKYGDGNPVVRLNPEELAAYIIELEMAVKVTDDQLLGPVLQRIYADDWPEPGHRARLEARRHALRALVNAAGELIDKARNARTPAALAEDGSVLPPTLEDLYPNHRKENQ
jgi:hypothetical protein